LRAPQQALRFLVTECQPPESREKRRQSVGTSSGETFLKTLEYLAPGCRCECVRLADGDAALDGLAPLESYDGVFLPGSPIHVYEETEDVQRQLAFMRRLFRSGTPSFGSCAGIQLAAAAAGGKVRRMPDQREVGFARRIFRTCIGAGHPLLAGRPPVYDAPSIHSDEVETLPEGALLLASNAMTTIQAAEIRHDGGIFWGVQYHPELTLDEVAKALERQEEDLIREGFVTDRAALDQVTRRIETLAAEPGRRDLAWQLGVDAQVTDPALRTIEIRNFIDYLVRPTCIARGRA
jgi:GMP synthase (glutamine-hydrolysing)